MSETNEGIFSCKGVCWIVGALLGVAAYLILRGRLETGFLLAVIVAVAVLVGAALLLRSIFCGGVEDTGAHSAATAMPTAAPSTDAPASTTPAAALDSAASASTSVKAEDAPAAPKEVAKAEATGADGGSKAADVGASSRTKTTSAKAAPAKKAAAKKKPAAKVAKPAAKKPAAKAAKPAVKKPAAKPAAKAAQPAAKKPTVKKDAAATSSSKTTTATKKPAVKPVAKDGKPRTMTAPRKAGADDLKMLKGVGPKLEQTLNELGFYHFDQVGGWRKKEVEWVDSRLKFKGRIERDGWVKQAKTLAKGGETEFSKKVSKGKVY